MKAVISVNKPVGLTPNQMIKKVRQHFPNFQFEKIGFAGRLDPMAKGVLLLLVGGANFEREKYLNLDKTYQFQALLGIETDSYDLLGLLETLNYNIPPENYQKIIEEYIKESLGPKEQPYPPFSTKPVRGKELFKWAREGKISQIEIPTKQITIFNFKQIQESTITREELQSYLKEKISKIEGVFRQEEILQRWDAFFNKNPQQSEFPTVTFEVTCSSGTYVRSLVQNLGKKLGCNALTFDINRTKVGTFNLKDSLNLTI